MALIADKWQIKQDASIDRLTNANIPHINKFQASTNLLNMSEFEQSNKKYGNPMANKM